ncbi:putative disease resistance protein [Abeliophyllum distichum]|uniref:Disease resistance protein n=1 Tax=Abeliophyllum distichum TaxID=126358 RepID=A0ABD1RVP1_9LAMI
MGLVGSTRRLSRESHVESTEKLREQLYQSLKGRRYLIAMDDVWDTNAWEEVKRLFPDDKNGSRIILTSRLSDVAIYASSTGPIHRLSFLTLEESWNLLRQNVFGEEDCPPDFEEIGKEIAEKCKGHPLTLVVLGGLLNKATRARDWEDSVETLNSEVTEIGDKVLEMLSLSYSHLPYHLRSCFLYFGQFPEDYEVRTSKLIKLWVAEGFVKPATTKSLEEVAEEYLEDLIARNMILVRERSNIGEVKTCSIHDLMRELCVRKAREEKFIYKYGSLVRSLLFFSRNTHIRLFSDTIHYRLLRVLDALTLRFDEFPIEIVELVNLRFIALTYMGNCKLPASIAKLRNLQTLLFYQGKFKVNINTLYLPAEIWKMPQLRHILFEKCFLPHPSGARNWKNFVGWENLTTLCKVTNFRCTREVLQMMPNLKKLGVSYYHGSCTYWSSYGFDNFIHLHLLENLKCVFIAKSFLAYRDPPPLNFAFPHKLKKLTLSGCRISWKNMRMVGSLPNLEVLKLKDHALQGTVWEPNEGDFCRLKLLVIHMSCLEHWKANETHFPSLQCLRLFYLINLAEIPYEIGDIPTLQAIHLYGCSPSAETSARSIQEEQKDLGNDDFQLLVRSLDDEKEVKVPSAITVYVTFVVYLILILIPKLQHFQVNSWEFIFSATVLDSALKEE